MTSAQPLTLQFAQGIDVRKDAKAVSAPYLARAQNVFYDNDLSLRKRNGYHFLSKNVLGGGQVTSGSNLSTFNNELLLFDNTYMYSYSPLAGAWAVRDFFIPTQVTATAAPTGHPYNLTGLQYVRTANYDVFVYQDFLNTTLYLTFSDIRSGTTLVQDAPVSGTTGNATLWRLVKTNAGAMLLFSAGPASSTLYAVYLGGNPLSPATAPYTVAAQAGAWGAAYDGRAVIVSWQDLSASPYNIRVAAYNENLTGTVGYYGNTITGNTTIVRTVEVACDPTNPARCWVFYNGSGAYYPTLSTTYTKTYTSPTVSLFADTSTFPRFAAAMAPGSLSADVIYGAGSNSSVALNQVYYANTTTPGGVASFTDTAAVTGPFYWQSDVYSWVGYAPITYAPQYPAPSPNPAQYSNQTVAMLYNWSKKRFVAKLGYGQSSYVTQGPVPVSSPATGTYAFPTLRATSLTSVAGVVSGVNAAYLGQVSFVPAYQNQNARLGGQQVFANGLPYSYDGARLTEHGFSVAPDIVGIDETATGTVGTFGTGTYFYRLTWEWTDAQGQLHQSAPSAPWSYVRTSGATKAPVIYFSGLQLTSKINVNAVLWRTLNNQPIYYRVGTAPAQSFSTFANSGGTTTAYAIVDRMASDTVLSGGTYLYTTSGELPNDAPVACSLMAAAPTRLLIAGGEQNNVVSYSKENSAGTGLGFSLAFTERVDQNPGAITGIASLDDKIVAFKASSVFFWSGEGPTGDGANNDFSAVQMISTDVGCVNPQSIVRTSDGLIFQGAKGLYQLDRSLGLTYIGAPVSPLGTWPFTTATLVPTVSQVRLGVNAPNALIYSYANQQGYQDYNVAAGQWTTFANYAQVGACLWQGAYAFCRPDGTVCVEDTGYADGAEPIPIVVQTGWIRPNGPLGAGQFSDVALMGNLRGPHTLQMDLATDYNTTPSGSLTFNAAAGTQTTTWGSSAWGVQPTFGGDSDNVYMLRGQLPVQTSSVAALQITLSDASVAGQILADSFTLGAIALMVAPENALLRAGAKKYLG